MEICQGSLARSLTVSSGSTKAAMCSEASVLMDPLKSSFCLGRQTVRDTHHPSLPLRLQEVRAFSHRYKYAIVTVVSVVSVVTVATVVTVVTIVIVVIVVMHRTTYVQVVMQQQFLFHRLRCPQLAGIATYPATNERFGRFERLSTLAVHVHLLVQGGLYELTTDR